METLSGGAEEALRDAKQRGLRRIEIGRKAREFAKPRVCDLIGDYSQEVRDRIAKGAPETLRFIFTPYPKIP